MYRATVMALALASAGPALASEVGTGAHPFGLGVSLGYPTAISAKYYLADGHAIDAALATASYDWGRRGGVYFHMTYLWHPSVLVRDSGFDLGWHTGVGGVVWSRYWGYWDDRWHGDSALGARVPLGLDMDLRSVRLQFFAELALNVYLMPGTFIDPGAALGIRYYF